MDFYVVYESMIVIFGREVIKRIYVYYGFVWCYRVVFFVIGGGYRGFD